MTTISHTNYKNRHFKSFIDIVIIFIIIIYIFPISSSGSEGTGVRTLHPSKCMGVKKERFPLTPT